MVALSFPDPVVAHCRERLAARLVPRLHKRNPGTNAQRERLNGKDDGVLHLTRTEKLAPCTAMAPEEEPQHDRPGQEAGQDQAPAGQDSEKSLSEDRDQP